MNNFLNPGVLWNVVWVVPMMCLVYLYAQSRRDKILKKLFGPQSESSRLTTVSKKRRQLHCLIEIAIVIFLILAAARPYWGFRPRPSLNKGRDIVFIFDTSKSMLAADVKPSRLKHAQWVMKEITSKFPHDRFGLVSFAGTAFLECPLTTDSLSFEQAVSDLSVDTMPIGGTNVEMALSVALKSTAGSLSGNSAFVLISDGDELDGDSRKVIDEMNAAGIPLFVIGVGEPGRGAVVELPGEEGAKKRYLRDRAGKIVMCKLNEPLLSELAKSGRGQYLRSSTDKSGVDEVSRWLSGLDATYSLRTEADRGQPLQTERTGLTNPAQNSGQALPIDRFQYPLAAAFILILLWLLISERNVRKLSVVLVAFLFTTIPCRAESKQNTAILCEQAATLLKQGEFAKGKAVLMQVVNNPQSSEQQLVYSFLNLGVIAQQRGENILAKLRADTDQSKERTGLAKECSASLQFARDMYARAASFNLEIPPLPANLSLLLPLELEARQLGIVFERKQKIAAEVDQNEPETSRDSEKSDEASEEADDTKQKASEPADSGGAPRKDVDDEETPESLIDAMINDEKEMRTKFKRQRGQNKRGRRAEKDW